jgi:hypothetical protein|tara:strand:- start:248 stop:508 length:261 start_codon:yes stop_codon:yes gene_type:complete
MTKEFQVIICAHGYRTKFKVKCEDSAEAIENSIVDRLGDSDIKWDETGFYDKSRKWITYEEVIDADTRKPLQTKEVIGVRLGAGAS